MPTFWASLHVTSATITTQNTKTSMSLHLNFTVYDAQISQIVFTSTSNHFNYFRCSDYRTRLAALQRVPTGIASCHRRAEYRGGMEGWMDGWTACHSPLGLPTRLLVMKLRSNLCSTATSTIARHFDESGLKCLLLSLQFSPSCGWIAKDEARSMSGQWSREAAAAAARDLQRGQGSLTGMSGR